MQLLLLLLFVRRQIAQLVVDTLAHVHHRAFEKLRLQLGVRNGEEQPSAGVLPTGRIAAVLLVERIRLQILPHLSEIGSLIAHRGTHLFVQLHSPDGPVVQIDGRLRLRHRAGSGRRRGQIGQARAVPGRRSVTR